MLLFYLLILDTMATVWGEITGIISDQTDLWSYLIKDKNIESISATKTLLLTDAYFQFLTPTVASAIVKLPTVTGSDYFECEIANISTTNAIVVQEPDNTPIVTLQNTGDKARTIYAFWDGSIWQTWIRGYY